MAIIKMMTKFDIVRYERIENGKKIEDKIQIWSDAFSALTINTKDLGDLIKALQDKQKEIER